MIVFSYSDLHTKVKCNLIERREIRRLLSAKPDGYMFAPKFKRGLWDGYISLLDRSSKFPSGLLSYLMDSLDGLNYEYDVENYTQYEFIPIMSIPGYEYRDYQTKAIQAALSHGRGVLKMATNAGKTLVASGILKSIDGDAVVVVPSQALLLQTSDDLENMLGMPIGRYGAGYKSKLAVTVVTMASLSKLVKKEDLSTNIAVIVDETHHGKSSQVFDNIFHIPGAYRFGMSGTPLTYERLSDMKLVGATGDIICNISNAELIDQGWSSKPVIKFTKITTPKIPATNKDWQDVYRQCIVGNSYRNAIISSIAEQERERGPVLIICNWVEHVNNIAVLGNFLTATGDTPERELESLLTSFDNSHDVLVASPVFGEGVNIPSVATIIMAAGHKSHMQILQRIGRGLRIAEGKQALHVYDFIDGTHKYLLKHSEERYKLYKEEGFETVMI